MYRLIYRNAEGVHGRESLGTPDDVEYGIVTEQNATL